MRLMIIGAMNGQIGAASQVAISRGAKVSHADDVEQGMAALRAGEGADIVMIDTTQDIRKLVACLESERITLPVVACGIGDDAKSAVNAIKAGAQEYVPLPPDAELIASILAAVTEENHAIVHSDPKTAAVLDMAAKIAPSTASVLIVGASGTGKELVAQFIHRKSTRAGKSFIAVNCAAIPENLLESELFGYEKGAFTGAVSRRIGKFEEANGGTLLLDEISEMDPRLQAKLLRAVQEREIDRIGGKNPVKVDVRVLATSNRDMQVEVARGNFREDLYFRLNVITITLPSLAERPADIEPLAKHFAAKYAEANGIDPVTVSPEAIRLLKSYPWPGNVRELENAIHRGVLLTSNGVLATDEIQLNTALPRDNAGPVVVPHAQPSAEDESTAGLVGMTVAQVERDLIIDTLDHYLGNRTHAANILGISIRTLRNKLKQYNEQGIAVPSPRESGEQSTV